MQDGFIKICFIQHKLLKQEMKEKEETLDAVASTLYKTEMDLKNEVRIRKNM